VDFLYLPHQSIVHHEVLLIRRIRELLYDQGFTISGARNRLSDVVISAPIADADEVDAAVLQAPAAADDDSPPLRAARQDAQLMNEQMLAAFLDFLRAATAAQPLVLVLEDLHWGDRPTVQFLDSALRELHLSNVQALRGRAETVPHELHRIAIAQAMAQPSLALEWLRDWVELDGWIVLPLSEAQAEAGPPIEAPDGVTWTTTRNYEVPLGGPRRRLWVGRRTR